MRRPVRPWICGLLATVALTGCVGKYQSDFSVIVENRAANALSVLADGNELGQVASGQSATFTLNLPETNANVTVSGVTPTPQGQVTMSAKDLKTGALSDSKTLTLSTTTATHVTFAASDFPSSVPTIARFTTSPTNPSVNQPITFNASSSTASNGVYAWDFGDGQSGGGVTTTHQYAQPSSYTVVLTVTSDNGQTSTSSRTVTVSAALPATSATYTFSPTAPAINQDVVFTATAGATVAGATFSWDFGDGSVGSGVTATHRYSLSGTYSTSLRVTSGTGQSATSSRTITVSGNLPAGSVNFSISPTSGGVNDTIYFNASASTGANLTFSWDFGDGGSGTGVTATHQYSLQGTFTVTLTGRNNLNQSASISKTITISGASTQLVAAFTFSPQDPTKSLGTNTVYFDATPSSSTATSWTWDFGDGGTGSGQKTTHLFGAAGTWVVRLTVADSTGRTATTTNAVTVKP